MSILKLSSDCPSPANPLVDRQGELRAKRTSAVGHGQRHLAGTVLGHAIPGEDASRDLPGAVLPPQLASVEGWNMWPNGSDRLERGGTADRENDASPKSFPARAAGFGVTVGYEYVPSGMCMHVIMLCRSPCNPKPGREYRAWKVVVQGRPTSSNAPLRCSSHAEVGRPHEISSDNSRAPYSYSSLETTHAAAIFRGLVFDVYVPSTSCDSNDGRGILGSRVEHSVDRGARQAGS